VVTAEEVAVEDVVEELEKGELEAIFESISRLGVAVVMFTKPLQVP